MKILISCLLAASAVVCSAQTPGTTPPAQATAPAPTAPAPSPTPGAKRLFVVDKVTQVGKTNVSNGGIFGTSSTSSAGEVHSAGPVMLELMKKCPAIQITRDQTTANYILETQMKGSTLSNAAGDVLYVSPAFKVNNMAKDVCNYLEKH